MDSSWHISEEYRHSVIAEAFSSLDKVFALKGELVTHSPLSRLLKVNINKRFYFVKLYFRGGKRLRRFIGRSRVNAEWENMKFFVKLGIPTTKLVGYGQELNGCFFKRGALITEELTNTSDLATLAQDHSPLLKDQDWAMRVGRQIAEYTKLLHDNRFIHNDLKWRNILVPLEDDPRICFIDCPTGRKRTGFMLRRGIVKDLACLDKVAKNYLSGTFRLWFFKVYRCHDRLTGQDKKMIKKIFSFFLGRE